MNSSPNFSQEMQGGDLSISHAMSRDQTPAGQSALSDRSGAWSYSDFSPLGNSLSVVGRETDLPCIASSFAFPQFPSWGTQQPPAFENWNPIYDYHFLPVQDENSARSLDTFLQDTGDQLAENSSELLCAPSTQFRGPNNSTILHGIVQGGNRTNCQQCNLHFSSRAVLEDHARETQHAPYRCRCGKPYSRLDVLHRHIRISQSGASYPCPHCKRHRGSRAFSRRDHLTQHLRGYHNMESGDDSDDTSSPASPRKRKTAFKCSHETCSTSGGMASLPHQQSPRMAMGRTFQTRSELTRHLREDHDESPFPCQELGCSRVGGKGFFREKDLLKHVEDHHTSAEI